MRINKRIIIDIESNRVIERDAFEYSGQLAQAVAATAITQKGQLNLQGGRFEAYTFTVDPGSIAAGAQEIETVAVTGARAGDLCWVNFEAPNANIITGGAKVTANDVVSVYLSNNITVTTATDSAAVVGHLLILKLSV